MNGGFTTWNISFTAAIPSNYAIVHVRANTIWSANQHVAPVSRLPRKSFISETELFASVDRAREFNDTVYRVGLAARGITNEKGRFPE